MHVCVRVCVREGSGMFVGQDYTSDAQPSYFNLLNLELSEECLGTLGMGTESSNLSSRSGAIGEQQLKQTQSGSSSRSGCNWGAAEADAIGEQQSKRRNRGAAVEADTIGEQQLKWTQLVSSS